MVFAGRFELPKPCGARPRSVELPWASQVRPLVELFVVARLFAAPETGPEGGLPWESWFWRPVVAEPFCDSERFGVWPVRLARLLLGRPADSAPVFIVRTGWCEAAAAGAVRAITERFCTSEGGTARACKFAAPKELWRLGVNEVRLLTSAPRKEASFRWDPLRWTAWPPTNALRDVAVTARVLCA